MNPTFFDKIQPALAVERLDAYRQDQAVPRVALARYLWNLALCESLYSPLQMVEIALRNALQRSLEIHFRSPHWYDEPACWYLLTTTQQSQIDEARQNLARQNKPLAPGRIVAELTFGFWTAFFNKRSAQNRDIVRLTARVFKAAPKSQRDIRSLNRRLTLLRELRNRVFHHERIIHWTDLDTRHAAMLETIGWISTELKELAVVLDRFPTMRKAGIQPWLEKLRHHWPDSAAASSPTTESIAAVAAPFDATHGTQTPFGHRWGRRCLRPLPQPHRSHPTRPNPRPRCHGRVCRVLEIGGRRKGMTGKFCSANGAPHTSPGQRPGYASSIHQALKGRHNPCLTAEGGLGYGG